MSRKVDSRDVSSLLLGCPGFENPIVIACQLLMLDEPPLMKFAWGRSLGRRHVQLADDGVHHAHCVGLQLWHNLGAACHSTVRGLHK
jgi:hypothetical protein